MLQDPVDFLHVPALTSLNLSLRLRLTLQLADANGRFLWELPGFHEPLVQVVGAHGTNPQYAGRSMHDTPQ